MRTSKWLSVIAIVFVGIIILALVVQQKRLMRSVAENRALGEQLKDCSELRAQRDALAKELSQLRYSETLSREQFLELMRLRAEIGFLRLRTSTEAVQKELARSQQAQVESEWVRWLSTVRANGVKPTDVPDLVRALTNDSSAIRLEASKALRLIGIERRVNTNLTAAAEQEWQWASDTAVPNLLSNLDDADPLLRANAAITLGLLSEQPDLVVPALAKLLGDQESRVSESAAKALGRFQQEARRAIPDLLRASSGNDEGLRKAAFAAIQQIAPEYFQTSQPK
jgi:hypothetical protein